MKFERHHSITSELTSRMTKLFVVSVINTAFIVLLTNALLKDLQSIVSEMWRGCCCCRDAAARCRSR